MGVNNIICVKGQTEIQVTDDKTVNPSLWNVLVKIKDGTKGNKTTETKLNVEKEPKAFVRISGKFS